ncbi:MAG: hypothetical protein PHR77_04580 [Kiritimatiellae bacterium]|nr:hypothetical protein [Kiritimatiellia bacterium]MDD5522367.1 hypothetical protein [Kiritimatiellia bacterium]
MKKFSHEILSVVLELILILLPFGNFSILRAESFKDVECGILAKISKEEFAGLYIPKNTSVNRIRAADFLKGRTHSGAIEAAIASSKLSGTFTVIVLDSQDWIIDRAILLPSNTELVISGCKLKLADGVFDNIIRVAGIKPNPQDPNGSCLSLEPVENIKITGLNGAIIEGADNPYTAANPKTGVVEKWVGDFFGWRTVGILISMTQHYEISGFTMQKTHCWAISQDWGCKYGYLHDIVFDTHVKNGDGIDFRNGCSYCLVENISGTTSDDTVACTALSSSVASVNSKYIWPMQSMGYACKDAGADADIHDIVIRNIRTSGKCHGVICLATSPTVYNIAIEDVCEETTSAREACVKIYTGYGTGYKKGNLRNIVVNNVVSRGAKYAVMVKAGVKDVWFNNIRQLKNDAPVYCFSGESENLRITNSETPATGGMFKTATCGGSYPRHLQGICVDDKGSIYWSFTDVLVKTDYDGHIMKNISVASHHGDLCYRDGKVYVAVNLRKFNNPSGTAADSWVYVYNADDLSEISRHKVPEAIYGAGGIACQGKSFMVVGGLPTGVEENYAYEYDPDFKFVKQHVIKSGYTLLGIQTVARSNGHWWFGCYGKPKVLLKTDEKFNLVGKYTFDCSLGIVGLSDGSFLVARGVTLADKKRSGILFPAVADNEKGLISRDPGFHIPISK